MTRKESRELTFAILFERAVTGETIEEILENAEESRGIELNEFIKKHVDGVYENEEKIDEVIKRNLKRWTFSRLSKVSVALLRLAVWELLYDESIPVGVSINEAVELAKTYGGKDDAPYINGVLSSVAKNEELAEKKN